MNKKLISVFIALGIVVAGGGYYTYSQYNSPLAKIARAEIEVTENIEKFYAERFEKDIKWFDSNKEKDKSLEINLSTFGEGAKIGAFYSPKEKVGVISGEMENPIGGTSEPVKVALRDKDKSILVETNILDYGLDFTESVIKKQIEGATNDSDLKEQIGYLDPSKIKISELARVLFFDTSIDSKEETLTTSEKKELFAVIPEGDIKDKGDDVYSLKLTKDTLQKMTDKYYTILKEKTKEGFEKKLLENQKEQAKKSLEELDSDIEVDYFLNIKDTVVRTFKFKSKEGEEVKINFETITTDNKLALTIVPEGEAQLDISTEKKEKGKYEDKISLPGEGSLVGESKTEGEVITTTYKEQTGKSSFETVEIKSDYSGNQLKYTLKVNSQTFADVVYKTDVKKIEQLVTEYKTLEGKTDKEQEDILNVFGEDIGMALIGISREEYEEMTKGLGTSA